MSDPCSLVARDDLEALSRRAPPLVCARCGQPANTVRRFLLPFLSKAGPEVFGTVALGCLSLPACALFLYVFGSFLHEFLGIAIDKALSVAFMTFILGFGLAAFFIPSARRCLDCRLALCPQHGQQAKAGPWFFVLAVSLMAGGTALQFWAERSVGWGPLTVTVGTVGWGLFLAGGPPFAWAHRSRHPVKFRPFEDAPIYPEGVKENFDYLAEGMSEQYIQALRSIGDPDSTWGIAAG